MASQPRARIDRLPTELFFLVAKDCCLSTGDLAALAATCCTCYALTNPILYQKHLKENHGIALMWAVERRSFATITRFMENGADINNDEMFRAYVDRKDALDSWKVVFDWDDLSVFTPLALAAALGDDSMVLFLLDHGADTEKPGKGLCTCADGRNVTEMYFPPDQSFGGNEDPYFIMDDENWFAWTPLHFALCRGHESTAIVLLERGADPRGTCPCEAGPWNALHTATRLKQRKVIDYILDHQIVDINEAGHEGLTPLLIAFYEKHYSLVDMYIDLGADINAVWKSKKGGWTILAMACSRDKFSRASDLLRRGADPDFILKDEENENEWTALGLIYGGLYGDWPSEFGCTCMYGFAADTASRRMLEQQIIQVKVDKALEQQRKEDNV